MTCERWLRGTLIKVCIINDLAYYAWKSGHDRENLCGKELPRILSIAAA